MKYFILLFALLIAGCQYESSSNEGAPPEIDLSTPDKAIKSMQAYNIWCDTNQSRLINDYFENHKERYTAFFSKRIVDTLATRYQKNYDEGSKSIQEMPEIENVDIQSDTRATVLVKTKEKTYGIYNDQTIIKIRYTMYKEDEKWLIENVERTCYSCDGIGQTGSYSSYSKRDVCEYCGGDGWSNTIFSEK